MALSLDSLGMTSPALVHEYSWRDVVLYALGIGATTSELDYLYEPRGPKVFPSYAVVPAFGAGQYLFERLGGDILGLVHGGQSLRMHKPFPPNGRVSSVAKVTEMHDLKRLAQVVMHTETRDSEGALLCEGDISLIFRFDGGFGGEPPPRRSDPKPPKREPDWVWEQLVPPSQALLYRLNGDLNPLHADPETAAKAGFERPILHGLCTYGYICRAVIASACGGEAKRLRLLSGHFRSPFLPGDTLVVEGWKEGSVVALKAYAKDKPAGAVFTQAYAEVD